MISAVNWDMLLVLLMGLIIVIILLIGILIIMAFVIVRKTREENDVAMKILNKNLELMQEKVTELDKTVKASLSETEDQHENKP